MNRRTFLQLLLGLGFSNNLFALQKNSSVNSKDFKIKMHGDLDDDLIVLKSTPQDTIITDIYQMHNSSGHFKFNGRTYEIEHSPGFIDFDKIFKFNDNEIYCITLANEREDAHITDRIRTHYKNEKLFINNQILLPDLMPEYNSVPGYPLWFGEDEQPTVDRKDINGNQYNYYKLFENTTVQFAVIVPKSAPINIQLFNQKNELVHTYNEKLTTTVNNLKSNELKNGNLNSHPFTELNNILNIKQNDDIENNDMVTNILVEYNNYQYMIPLPYPLMYPNLIFGAAAND